jgi:hypothetical protein
VKRVCTAAVVLALGGACVPRAARIPPKAATDMQCPEHSLTVLEVDNQGDSGPHLVMGCGKKAVYELNNFGEWVVNAPISTDPTHVKPPPPTDAQPQ